MSAPEALAPASDAAQQEFLYGTWQNSTDTYVTTEVVAFPVVKKTQRRIYYDRGRWAGRGPATAYVDRQAFEADGEVYKRSLGWWEPDFHLSAVPADLTPARPPAPNLRQLKAAMAEAHPDRGGNDEQFIEARAAYERARCRSQGQKPERTA